MAFPFILSSPNEVTVTNTATHTTFKTSNTTTDNYTTTKPIATSSSSNSLSPGSEQHKQQQKQHEECNKYVQNGLSKDPTIKFLMENLLKLGCKPPQGFINCIDCGNKKAGAGFGMIEETILSSSASSSSTNDDNNDNNTNIMTREEEKEFNHRQTKPKCQQTLSDLQNQIKAQNANKIKLRLLPEIFLCQQHLVNQEHSNQSLVHELIHAIDLCRTKMDPINNCIHMACTEIRAENLSGECGIVREMVNGRIRNFKGHGSECVKRRAILSVEANPNCKVKAKDYVDVAFERCFKDTFPFDRHPNLR